MSITVVSTPPMPTPGNVSDSGSASDVSATQDFANLLQGQLATNAAQPTAVIDLPTSLPNSLPTDLPSTDAVAAEATPVDAASLLAALGLAAAPTEAKPADKAPDENTASDVAPADAAASVLAAFGLAATPSGVPAQAADSTQQQVDEPLTAASGSTGQSPLAGPGESLKAEPAVAAATGNDDKAAKFAVASAPSEETASAEPVVSDAPVTAIVQPGSNTASHVNNIDTKNDSSLSVTTHVRDKAWASDLGQKVVWLASHDKQSAQLTLNPPQMGPIEVSVDVDKGNASVSFASANAEVRDAIETALPKLREMFASAGIELGQTNVGAQSFNQQQAWSGEQKQSSSRWMNDNAILAAETAGSLQTGTVTARQGNGMVDIFA